MKMILFWFVFITFILGVNVQVQAQIQAQTQIQVQPILPNTAYSGHQFQNGDDLYQILDVESPHAADLHPLGRLHSAQAKQSLQRMLANISPPLKLTGKPTRWGAGQIRASALAKMLLVDGAVRVIPVSNDFAAIDALYKSERRARKNRNGLWSHRFYRVRDANAPADCNDAIGSIQIIQGSVQKIGKFSNRFFLNFGDDYRTDVTATIRGALAHKWAREGFEITALEGKTIRVRGYLEWINGPSLQVTHPLAIELINDDGSVAPHPMVMSEQSPVIRPEF